MKTFLVSLVATFFLCLSVLAQEKPTAFINARIIPIVGQPIEQGILLIQNGKITAVGDARTVKLSSDVITIDLSGKLIMPGLVDSHSHVGEPAERDHRAMMAARASLGVGGLQGHEVTDHRPAPFDRADREFKDTDRPFARFLRECLDLAIAEHQHVRDLLLLGGADLVLHPIR